MEPDGGTTNIRNVKSKHWTRWLGPENRSVVPLNSFSEFNKAAKFIFAADEKRRQRHEISPENNGFAAADLHVMPAKKAREGGPFFGSGHLDGHCHSVLQ